MKIKCWAPLCSELVEISPLRWFLRSLYNYIVEDEFDPQVLCPKHAERISSGDLDDGDPTTNPDLN